MRALCLFVCASSPALASELTIPSPFAGTSDPAATEQVEVFEFVDSAYPALAAAHESGTRVRMTDFALPGRERITLALRPVRVMEPGARAVVTGEAGESFVEPTVLLFSGHVPGRASTAFLGIAPEQQNGYVELEGERFFLSSGRDPGAPVAVSHASAVQGAAGDWCRVIGPAPGAIVQKDEVPLSAEALGGGPVVRDADVYIELDHEYNALFFFDVQAINYAVTLFGAASEVYRRDIGCTITIPDGYMRLWADTPPWGELETHSDIASFVAWWSSPFNPQQNIPRAAVQVLTHPVFGGVANNIGGLCTNFDGYEVSSVFGAFPYPIQHTSEENWDLLVVAHEFGHTFGSPHTFNYSPPIPCVDGSGPDMGTLMGYCHLDFGVEGVGMRFHPTVQNTIRAYLNTVGCLASTPIQLGDYDADGAPDAGDLDVLDAYLVQGFHSDGSEETFDMDDDGDVDAVDRQLLFDSIFGTSIVRYCTPASPNVTGNPAAMDWNGSVSVAANDLVLRANPVPVHNTGIFIYSPDQASVPLGNGTLCIGASTLGFVIRLGGVTNDLTGTAVYALDLTAPPVPVGQIGAGSTWNFSYWFRDPLPASAGFNFSDALAVTFAP